MSSNTSSEGSEFATVLLQHAKGRAHDEATKALAEVVEAVKRLGKKGEVTLKLTVIPVKNDQTMVYLEDNITATVPKEPRNSLFFTDDHGGLHRNQPGLYGSVDADTIPTDGKSAGSGRS